MDTTLFNGSQIAWLNKVPAITISFWVIKVMSTTVGETGADFLAVNAGWGQAVTSLVMAGLLAAALVTQLCTRRYTPWIYWLTVVLVSVVGTQITDLLTDGLGVSLYVSTSVFALALAAIFLIWYRVEHTLQFTISSRSAASCFIGPRFSAPLRSVPPPAIWRQRRWDLASPLARWLSAR